MPSANAKQLYSILKKKIEGLEGTILINIGDTKLVLEEKDAFGSALQSWIGEYINKHRKTIGYSVNKNSATQKFPDYFLKNLTTRKKTDLEIKTFDMDAHPNFDVANFRSYVDSLTKNPDKLNADYLIIGYTLMNGIVTIKKIWLKNVWEICTTSKKWPLKMQVKKDTIYNIRPVPWYSSKAKKPFLTRYEFVEAIQEVLNQYDLTKNNYKNWLKNLESDFQKKVKEKI